MPINLYNYEFMVHFVFDKIFIKSAVLEIINHYYTYLGHIHLYS